MNKEEFLRLATLYLEDAIDEDELKLLGRELDGSPERVQQFNDLRLLAGLIHEHGQNSEEFKNRLAENGGSPSRNRAVLRWIFPAVLACLPASILMAIVFVPRDFKQPSIATLTSSENAAWESSLPTAEGSKLGTGTLRLKSGIASIRFNSGAVVTLEAPALLELLDPMRGRLLSGKATIDVPEPAIGFVMETPDSFAVDHGTQFSVSVNAETKRSNFNVIDGEISVHVTSTGKKALLSGLGRSATVSEGLLVTIDSPQPSLDSEPSPNVVRIGTGGREGTAIRNDRREYIRPKFLTVNNTFNKPWERRSFFSFDLAGVDVDGAEFASLRLNLVSFPYGFFSCLPTLNQYAIYGMTNPEKADWEIQSNWEDSPGPEDGQLLGKFEIARSQQQGAYGIANEKLLTFLRQNKQAKVTFIVVRESEPIRHGDVPCHAFAGQSHSEANGPKLEFGFSLPE